METEKITYENEHAFLETQYPEIILNGETIRFSPKAHTMEKGEAAFFLDIENGTVGKDIITHVAYSAGLSIPIYYFDSVSVMYHRVWPNVEGQKILDRINKGNLIKKVVNLLSKEEQALLID